jgi:pSer/pThr/pTyr-binding forkhead associated (FHA) protein
MARSTKRSQANPPDGPPETSSKPIGIVLVPPLAAPDAAQNPGTEAGHAPPPAPAPARLAIPFRPLARPKVAVLTVCDDGKTDGEVIRIRSHRFIIGRTEGDLCIPIDGRISARHVEITLQTIGVHHRWVVTDLQSTHGLFVRVSRTRLAEQAEFLVGSGRYQFDGPHYGAAATTDEGAFSQTHGWVDPNGPYRPPALTEVLGHEIGNRILLDKPEYWIGSGSACAICRADDPFCEQRHVRLYRKANGAWHAENNKTQNGLWVRMSQITVESMAQFQIGEQRFQLRVR